MKKLLSGVFILSGVLNFSYKELEIFSHEEYTNVRLKPDKNSKIIDTVGNLNSVRILKKEENWYFVKLSGGKRGYIHESQVRDAK